MWFSHHKKAGMTIFVLIVTMLAVLYCYLLPGKEVKTFPNGTLVLSPSGGLKDL